MVTRKTVSAPSPETPRETSNYSLRRGFWWSLLRITIAVIVISGAYIVGVICGMSPGDWNYKGHDGYRNSQKYMQMMKHRGPMEEEKMPMNMSSMSHDPMSMSMADMGKMLEGQTGDTLNKAFLEGMIPHHQGAIDMAKYLAGSNKPELVKLGADIISAQQKEIDQMKAWQVAWGYTSTGATPLNPEGEMMREHCRVMPNMVGCEKYR